MLDRESHPRLLLAEMKMRNMLKHTAVWVAALLLLMAVAPAAAKKNCANRYSGHGNVADLKVTDKDYTLRPKDALDCAGRVAVR